MASPRFQRSASKDGADAAGKGGGAAGASFSDITGALGKRFTVRKNNKDFPFFAWKKIGASKLGPASLALKKWRT